MEPLKLTSVRPFVMDAVCLADTRIHPQDDVKVDSYLTKKVHDLVEAAKEGCENEKLPLVRLKVRENEKEKKRGRWEERRKEEKKGKKVSAPGEI